MFHFTEVSKFYYTLTPVNSGIIKLYLLVEPQKVNIEPQKVNVEPQKVNVEPQKVNVEPQKVNIEPQKVNVEVQKVNFEHQRLIFCPFILKCDVQLNILTSLLKGYGVHTSQITPLNPPL